MQLSDGRKLEFGGQYEDWYDPDFEIFNGARICYPGVWPAVTDPNNVTTAELSFSLTNVPATDCARMVEVPDASAGGGGGGGVGDVYIVGNMGYANIEQPTCQVLVRRAASGRALARSVLPLLY